MNNCPNFHYRYSISSFGNQHSPGASIFFTSNVKKTQLFEDMTMTFWSLIQKCNKSWPSQTTSQKSIIIRYIFKVKLGNNFSKKYHKIFGLWINTQKIDFYLFNLLMYNYFQHCIYLSNIYVSTILGFIYLFIFFFF